jgi:hypothetical protein
MADITYSAEFNILTGKLKQGVADTRKGIKAIEDSINNAQNTTAGFSTGLKEGFSEAANEAKKLGANIAHNLTPALIGIQAGVKVLSSIGSAIKDAFMQNEKFARSVEILKGSLGQSFADAVAPAANFFSGLIEHIAQSIEDSNTLRNAVKLLREEVSKTTSGDNYEADLKKQYEALTAAQEVAQREFDTMRDNDNTAWLLVADEKMDKINDLDIKRREIQNELHSIEADRAARERIDAQAQANETERAEAPLREKAQLHILNEQQDVLARQAIERAKALGYMQEAELLEVALIKAQREREKLLLSASDEYTSELGENFDKVTDGMIAAVHRKAAAEAQARADADAKQKDADAALLASQENEKKEKAAQLEKARASILDNQLDTLARQAIEQAKALGYTEEAERLEIELIRAQREREKLLLLASDEYTTASREDQEKLKENFVKVTQGMVEAVGTVKDELEELSLGDKFAGLEAEFSNLTANINSIINSLVQKEIENINELFEADMENLKKERQLALEAAGLAKIETEENLQAALDAAKASGDEMVIYKETRRQEELAINKNYDTKEAEREEKARKEKADLEYKAAMTEWTFSLLMAPVHIAEAVLKSYAEFATLGPVMATLAKINGVAQVGAIIAAKPRKQYALGAAFDEGREVVTSPTNFNIGQMGEAGAEAIMPLTRMKSGALGVASMGTTQMYIITVPITLDEMLVANVVVKVVNDGFTPKIDARMVKK